MTSVGTSQAIETSMSFTGRRRYVGFGFGPIQAGLFLYEAHKSGAFAEPLVVDVRADLVTAVRDNGGHFALNIARANRVDTVTVGPVEVADSLSAPDRARIVAALATADEVSTALPSVDYYRSDGPSSPHRLLAEGLLLRPTDKPVIVYCAENHRHAASILETAVLEAILPAARDEVRRRVRFVDTVIGKMSGTVEIGDPGENELLGLVGLTPSAPFAYLVEEFDHILISRVSHRAGDDDDVRSSIPALHEVADLEPFQDAKLFGHNATHALAAFLGQLMGLRLMSELTPLPGALEFLEAAFVEEAGAALIRRYGGVDSLFTADGFQTYARDLLARMTNPFLRDTIARAARDPIRKLGWDDRLIGTLRLGMSENITPRRFAMGAAAALATVHPEVMNSDRSHVERLLRSVWQRDVAPQEAGQVVDTILGGMRVLRRGVSHGFEGLELDLRS